MYRLRPSPLERRPGDQTDLLEHIEVVGDQVRWDAEQAPAVSMGDRSDVASSSTTASRVTSPSAACSCARRINDTLRNAYSSTEIESISAESVVRWNAQSAHLRCGDQGTDRIGDAFRTREVGVLQWRAERYGAWAPVTCRIGAWRRQRRAPRRGRRYRSRVNSGVGLVNHDEAPVFRTDARIVSCRAGCTSGDRSLRTDPFVREDSRRHRGPCGPSSERRHRHGLSGA